jgi:O-methyltransferase involved in polyketide biosynthesis
MEIDTTKPHVGRMYDFVLGGHHNYEADRHAAEEMRKMVPAYPKWARLNRWFLQLVGSRWAEAGFLYVLDLGSGLPTQGHLNDYLTDAKILFSDNDPLSVAYGAQLLADKPNMRYVLADARHPQPLLDAAADLFGVERRIAVGLIGFIYFLSDDELRELAAQLHRFCAPGSSLAVSFPMPRASEVLEKVPRASAILNMKGYLRSPEATAALLEPWKVDELKPLKTWLDVDDLMTEEDYATYPIEFLGLMARHE